MPFVENPIKKIIQYLRVDCKKYIYYISRSQNVKNLVVFSIYQSHVNFKKIYY